MIEYELDAVARTVRITTDMIAQSTVTKQGFGYAISGTTRDSTTSTPG